MIETNKNQKEFRETSANIIEKNKTVRERSCFIVTREKLLTTLLELYPVLVNFPKAEKFCLSSDIKKSFTRMISSVTLANKVKSKRIHYLEEAQISFEMLSIYIQISRNRKYISKGYYDNLDLKLSEIGNEIKELFYNRSNPKGLD